MKLSFIYLFIQKIFTEYLLCAGSMLGAIEINVMQSLGLKKLQSRDRDRHANK